MAYRALTHTENQYGNPVSILAVEGQVSDIAAYIIDGKHDDADYVFEHGRKLTEREARRHITWPVRLTYRR